MALSFFFNEIKIDFASKYTILILNIKYRKECKIKFMNWKIMLGIFLSSCTAVLSLTALSLSVKTNSVNVENNYSNYVTLGDYKSISTGLSVAEVTDEDIEDTIQETIDVVGGYYETDENATVEEGYQVEASLQLVDTGSDSEPFELTFVVGDENYPEEFSEGIIGLKAGESTTVTLSEEYDNAEYIITVINVNPPADITDEFVETLYIENVSTVEELREDIKEYLTERNESEYNEAQKNAVSEKVIANASVTEIPEELIESYVEILNKKVEVLIEVAQEEAEDGEEVTKTDVLADQMKADEFVGTVDEYIEWYAEKNAKEYMIYSTIAEIENIEVSDDELYSSIAADWQTATDEYETLLDFIEAYGKEQYEMSLLSQKVIEFLAENSVEGLVNSDTEEEKVLDNTTVESSTESSIENDAVEDNVTVGESIEE